MADAPRLLVLLSDDTIMEFLIHEETRCPRCDIPFVFCLAYPEDAHSDCPILSSTPAQLVEGGWARIVEKCDLTENDRLSTNWQLDAKTEATKIREERERIFGALLDKGYSPKDILRLAKGGAQD